MARQRRAELPAAAQVPQPHGAVVGAAREPAAVRAEGDASHLAATLERPAERPERARVPEAHHPVVRRAREDAAVGTERDAPAVAGRAEGTAELSPGAHVPEAYPPVEAVLGDGVPVGRERDRVHRIAVPGERPAELPPGLHVPEQHHAVEAAARQRASVRAEHDRPYFPRVPIEGPAELAVGLHVPEANGLVRARACERASVGAEGHAVDAVGVAGEWRAELPMLGQIPETDGAVPVGCREGATVRAESDARDRAVRAVQHRLGSRAPRSLERGSGAAARLRCRADLVRLEAQEQRDVRGARDLVRGCRREREGEGLIPLADRILSLQDGHHRQPDRDGEGEEHRSQRESTPPRRGAAAGAQVRELQGGGRRLLPGLLVAPRLRLAEVAATQQEASVAGATVPLGCAQAEPGVSPCPVGVDAHRLQELCGPLVELRIPREVDPLRLPQLVADGSPVRVAPVERPQPLALLHRPVDLEPAVRRGERVRAQHDQERVGSVDPAVELVLVVGRPVRDVLPIDVDLLPGRGERSVEALDELAIAPRVADEGIGNVRGRRRRTRRTTSGSPACPPEQSRHATSSSRRG